MKFLQWWWTRKWMESLKKERENNNSNKKKKKSEHHNQQTQRKRSSKSQTIFLNFNFYIYNFFFFTFWFSLFYCSCFWRFLISLCIILFFVLVLPKDLFVPLQLSNHRLPPGICHDMQGHFRPGKNSMIWAWWK